MAAYALHLPAFEHVCHPAHRVIPATLLNELVNMLEQGRIFITVRVGGLLINGIPDHGAVRGLCTNM